jgi:hypothetical protein
VNFRQWLLRTLDARWMMLLKEQDMAFVRAIGAGFVIKNVGDLVLFAEDFGAYRLRYAISNCKFIYIIRGNIT